MQIRDIAHFKSGLYLLLSESRSIINDLECDIVWLHATNHLYHGFPS